MSDPHGWDAQNRAIQAQRRAAQQRSEQDLHGGAAAARRKDEVHTASSTQEPAGGDEASTSPGQLPYWAAVVYCPHHNLWGCAVRQREQRRALYEAHSAASRHGSTWCPDLNWVARAAGYLSPGYIMAFRNGNGGITLGGGRSKRAIAKKLRGRLDADAEVLLLVSVKRGVLVANGIDLQVGWTKDMPGGM